MLLDEITQKIIGCAYRVNLSLGCGFLEKVYENAMILETRKSGLRVKSQHSITIQYEGTTVGEYIADLLVEDRVLVELKAVESLDKIHFAQCMNYLKATGLKTCLLINFGRQKVQVRRLNGYFAPSPEDALSHP